ncbi:MAG: glycerate kinase [Verrucomicrobiales bacterium]|nr:glycerate kinase [Verrucomicrobiales bacterium]
MAPLPRASRHDRPSTMLAAMRVLIAPDQFKGTLAADAVARAIAAGWRSVRPSDSLTLVPMSDGGDGFGAVLGKLIGARTLSLPTTNAACRPHRARWWWVDSSRTAILEAAQSNGLALLPKGLHHPFALDTFGVARLVLFALRKGAKRCVVGVGGSATNDGGFGLARGLGWTFHDRAGNPIHEWTELRRLHRLTPPAKPLPACRFVVATDVENPLLGKHGATRVYGPQKGLTPADFPVAEAALRRLAAVVRRQLGFDSSSPGAGAAGGLGFGFMAFLGAERRLGFDIFAEHARLDARIRDADVVVTGEGAFDFQSVMGKGVGQCIHRARRAGRPVVVLAGRVADDARAAEGVRWLEGLCDITSTRQAMERTAAWLRRLAARAASAWTDDAGRRTRSV